MNLRERMRALRETWSLTGYDLDAGVGIAEGDPTLGRVGFEARFDYRATRTVVNLASRRARRRWGSRSCSRRARTRTSAVSLTLSPSAPAAQGIPRPRAGVQRDAPRGLDMSSVTTRHSSWE